MSKKTKTQKLWELVRLGKLELIHGEIDGRPHVMGFRRKARSRKRGSWLLDKPMPVSPTEEELTKALTAPEAEISETP